MDNFYKFQNNNSLKVNTIWCIGRNYAEHAKEMGANVEEQPVVFLKPSSAYISDDIIRLPDYSDEVHYECEIVIVIGKDAFNIEPDDAHKYIAGIGLGLDLTLRDIQSELKKKSLPWALSKSFFGSAPISSIIDINEINLRELEYNLLINNELKQKGNVADMIFSFEELISFISKRFSLQKGDCIFTGTPAGVGKLNKNDKLNATLNNIIKWDLEVK
jgi:2-keto-4-pentenoate hydratase/2-oxohepta-3-ene-1,7-dioic acid hydratase in catechol pathway